MYQVLSACIYQVLSNVPQYEASLINFDITEVGFNLLQKRYTV